MLQCKCFCDGTSVCCPLQSFFFLFEKIVHRNLSHGGAKRQRAAGSQTETEHTSGCAAEGNVARGLSGGEDSRRDQRVVQEKA